MRVIGGKFRGKKLKSLEGEATRPTLDRVKEAIFNMAMPWLYNAVVLDLFGGSGGLAIEAVSRGAKKAYINDGAKSAVKIIEENVCSVGCEDSVKVFCADWQSMLNKAQQESVFFDIVFLDPPYANGYIHECVEKCKELLNDGGVIIIEHDESVSFKNDVLKEKKYGKVYVTFIGEENE